MKLILLIKKFYHILTSSKNVLSLSPVYQEHTMDDIEIENPFINSARIWAISRLQSIKGKDAAALASEFDEWINIPDDMEEIDYMSLQQEDTSK